MVMLHPHLVHKFANLNLRIFYYLEYSRVFIKDLNIYFGNIRTLREYFAS